MRSEQVDPEKLLPLTAAVFNILLAFADGERHGFSIMQEISEQTKGRLRIGPTTLYRSIKHLSRASWSNLNVRIYDLYT